ncbi:MAG TPA: hypothetical protein VKV40_03845 [Ktedonobacteraceae bacterium]|nr:hypothetical protein [Ktedonobacteraceae bacterium]
MTQTEDAPEKLLQSMWEMDEAVIKNITAAQQRGMQYTRSIFEDGVEVLKENARENRILMESLLEQEPQQVFQSVTGNAVAAQERNIKYAQEVVQSGIEALKSQIESNRTLMHTLAEQTQKQQETLQELTQELMKEYLSFFSTPFSFYQRMWERVQQASSHGA